MDSRLCGNDGEQEIGSATSKAGTGPWPHAQHGLVLKPPFRYRRASRRVIPGG